jgi:pimeloyl-ACP methyl ester carboxylesterase
MRPVLLVHGINSSGKWQDQVSQVLNPHFKVVKVKYWHYRWLGATKLLFEPWGFVLFGSAAYFIAVPYLPKLPAILIALLLGLLMSYFFAPIRRNYARRSVVEQGDSAFAFDRPHIIAHSFGTYLTGSALINIPALHARRVVLVGCVLSSKLNWRALKGKKPRAFDAVRNDWTNKDSVVRLASIIERRIPDFGHAGLTGFDLDPGWVHSVAHPDLECSSCSAGSDALIHNFDCSGLGHSDAFLGRAHTVHFWLPFLWEIGSREYGALLDYCEAANDAFDTGDNGKMSIVEDELLRTVWKWAHGKDLETYFTDLIEKDPRQSGRPVSELLGRVTASFWTAVDRGRRAALEVDATQKNWIVNLHPMRAAANAVNEVLSAP